MHYLVLSSIMLCAAAAADGITTVIGIKSGKLVEGNKFLDWIYGTDTPKAWQTLGIGYAIIAGEILLAAMLGHAVHFVSPSVWPTGLSIQSGLHVYAAISNYKLIKSTKE